MKRTKGIEVLSIAVIIIILFAGAFTQAIAENSNEKKDPPPALPSLRRLFELPGVP